MENQVKRSDPLPAVRSLRSKYYKTFRQRIAAKTSLLVKPDPSKKIIARLKAEIDVLAFKFRAIFDNTGSYFIIMDRQLNIIDHNKASSRLIKKLFGKQMIDGQNITNFLHPSSVKMIMDHCTRALGGEKFGLERMINYLDQTTTWWLFEYSPAKNLRGNITGIVFNAHDISKRKAYESKILAQHKKLMKISSVQSHEVRGPVCTIMGIMSLIKEQGYEPDKKYLMLLEKSVNKLDKNIHDIVGIANDDD